MGVPSSESIVVAGAKNGVHLPAAQLAVTRGCGARWERVEEGGRARVGVPRSRRRTKYQYIVYSANSVVWRRPQGAQVTWHLISSSGMGWVAMKHA